MPVFKSGKALAPAWCELEYFDIVKLVPGQTHTYERVGIKERLLVGKGCCTIAIAGQAGDAAEGAKLDLPRSDGQFEVTKVTEPVTLIRMCGRWGQEVGSTGIFTRPIVAEYDLSQDRGDPPLGPKNTYFDNHFHDCDEYWIIFEGPDPTGEVTIDKKRFTVGPGDCVATGMGHHHDFPMAYGPFRAVYCETTMEGSKRRGHLWEHKHGRAEPKPERV